MSGLLIAFEGLDQSGKETQAVALRDRLKQEGGTSRLVSFPDYGTSIGV
jgi:thymidylate kinase